jgi:hypothetical protein
MKKSSPFVLALLVSLMLPACGCMHLGHDCIEGTGKTNTESRNLRDFKGVDLRIAGNAEVTMGPNFEVTVQAEESLLPHVKTTIEDGTLIIDSKECFHTGKQIVVRVTLPELRNLELSGSGDIKGMNALNGDKMYIALTGSGSIDAEIAATVVRTVLAGSGDVMLRGKAKDHEIKIAGSGDVHAGEFATDNTTARISGSGNCELRAAQLLRASISGSGNVYYRGHPNKVESQVSGSGEVKAR